jgi:short-subunit dehydrogenase
LASFGVHVVLASRNIEKLKHLEEEVEELGGGAFTIATDITQGDQVD